MSADIEFERRIRTELRSTLDRADGPHPQWATSPAAATVAADPVRPARQTPWRLLAVAAVLVGGSVAALILASPDDRLDAGVPGCPTLADYAAASAQPSPPEGKAPDVSFPPVAPSATMTTGILQPGEWAVVANAEGPGLQLRVRDVRDCGRLPDIRSYNEGGSIYLATVDARVLRDNSELDWLGVRGFVGLSIGDGPGAIVHGFGVPGVNTQTRLTVPEGFAASSTVILDIPATDKRVTLDHPTENTHTLPGLTPTVADWPRARWLVRDGDPTGDDFTGLIEPLPEATPTVGEVRLGEDIAMVTSAGAGIIRLTNLDETPAYPGLAPAPDHVFVEVLATVRDMGRSLVSLQGWRAVGPDGEELTIVHNEYGSDPRPGLLSSLLGEEEDREAWIVIEAPAQGQVRLEYHHEDLLDQMFWIQLRP